jgi:hypothetical protein
LHDQDFAEAVDDKAGQPVGLAVNEAVIGLREQPLAQAQGPLQPPREKPLPDHPRRVAIKDPRRHQRMRVEHGDAHRPLIGALQRDQRAGRQRLCRRVDAHLGRIDPGMAAGAAALAAGQQDHRGARRRLVGGNRAAFSRYRCFVHGPPGDAGA